MILTEALLLLFVVQITILGLCTFNQFGINEKLYKYKGIFDCFEAKIKPSLFWIYRQYYTNYIEALYYEITRRTSAGSCIVWRRQPWRKVPTFRYIFLINDPSLVSSNYFLNIHCAYTVWFSLQVK